MNSTNRLTNNVTALNAWRDVVRGCSLKSDAGFCAPTLGFGYQPEHIQSKVHSGGKGR